MTAVSEPNLGPAVNIVDAFAQNLKEMKMKKKATRVRSIDEQNPLNAAPIDLQLGFKKDRKAGRRLPRKSGNSNSNLAALAEGGPTLTPMTRCTTDNSLSLLGRVATLKEKAGGTVDPDELLKRRREARAARATTTNTSAATATTTTKAGGLGRRGSRKSLNSSGNLSATNLAQVAQQLSQNNLNRMPGGPSLVRSTTDPTISLQARMEKLKQKQKDMPDPDEMLKKRRESRNNKTSKLFGSAPNLPGLAIAPEDREKRRMRRINSRGKRLSRTTSAGRIHDEMEVPTLATYHGHSMRRSVTDSDSKYAVVDIPALKAYGKGSSKSAATLPALKEYGDSTTSA